MSANRIGRSARAKAMLCFEVAVTLVTLVIFAILAFAGISFVIGLLAVYWAGFLAAAAFAGLAGAGRRHLRPNARASPKR